MNLFKIYYILSLQLWAVFIYLQGHAQIRKERKNLKFRIYCISKADSVCYVPDAVKSVKFSILELQA